MVTTPTRPAAPGKDQRKGASVRRGPRNRRLKTAVDHFFAELWPRLEGRNKAAAGSSYYLILGATLALTAIGLMMVLSSSSVEALTTGESSYQLFLKQGGYAVAGVIGMLVLSRLKPRGLKRLAWPGLFLALVLLVLVLAIGTEVNGNKNWIIVGPFSAQPSEAAKLALSVWMATVLSRKIPLLNRWKHVIIPVIPVAAVASGLVAIGHDLGTTVLIMMIVAAALYFAGTPMKMFAVAGMAAAAGAIVLALTSGNRMGRISTWLGHGCDNGLDLCYQSTNGIYALASGGWLGVGLGQSRQKWNWIPEAHNDFIFAIIGEELGLVGTLVVLALFAILAVAIFRVINRHDEPFVRIVCGSIMIWILGQAVVNISMVTGLLPVIGVPLPFISYGGSALVCALAGIGVILSFARVKQESDTSIS